jgi:hypothetical protein
VARELEFRLDRRARGYRNEITNGFCIYSFCVGCYLAWNLPGERAGTMVLHSRVLNSLDRGRISDAGQCLPVLLQRNKRECTVIPRSEVEQPAVARINVVLVFKQELEHSSTTVSHEFHLELPGCERLQSSIWSTNPPSHQNHHSRPKLLCPSQLLCHHQRRSHSPSFAARPRAFSTLLAPD